MKNVLCCIVGILVTQYAFSQAPPYQNVIAFNYQSDINYLKNNWTVPTGVTKVKVELWGAGGGGSCSVGGQGGCYTMFTLAVTSGTYMMVL